MNQLCLWPGRYTLKQSCLVNRPGVAEDVLHFLHLLTDDFPLYILKHFHAKNKENPNKTQETKEKLRLTKKNQERPGKQNLKTRKTLRN